MRSFKICSVGWNCGEFIADTLQSLVDQVDVLWECMMVLDLVDDNDPGIDVIEKFTDDHPVHFGYQFYRPGQHGGAVFNRWSAIEQMRPHDDDVIVFLDIDGDQLSSPAALSILRNEYSDDTLLTYGSYRTRIPDEGSAPAIPYPAEVIEANSYRAYTRDGGVTCFNHLRTMSGRVFNNTPVTQFQDSNGQWYPKGVDYMFTVSGLELAGRRHKCLEDVLMVYNNANPRADYLNDPDETNSCVRDFLNKEPLTALS